MKTFPFYRYDIIKILEEMRPFGIEIGQFIIIGSVVLFYFLPYFFISGQTFGKRMQKIKIVTIDDQQVPIWRILLR